MNYFTADLHLHHENRNGGIVNLCNRPYPNVPTMTQDLIQKSNEIVTDSDTIHDLGDVAFRCSAWDVVESLKQMNGKRIILLGNHDKALRQAYKKGLLKDLIKRGKIEIIGGDMAINDHTLSLSKMLTIQEQRVFISHYATRTWPNAFRGSYHLFGHSHSNLSPFYKSFDVGVDTETESHRRFYPWSWDEIVKRMNLMTKDFEEK